jgi:hypothetical protein
MLDVVVEGVFLGGCIGFSFIVVFFSDDRSVVIFPIIGDPPSPSDKCSFGKWFFVFGHVSTLDRLKTV